jgi:hypothetical protein
MTYKRYTCLIVFYSLLHYDFLNVSIILGTVVKGTKNIYIYNKYL